VSHRREDREFRILLRPIFVGDFRDAREAQNPGYEAVTAAQLNDLAGPTRNVLLCGDDQQADRAANTRAQVRHIDGPNVPLVLVVAELHFKHDPKNWRSVQEEDHQVRAIFRGLDVREIGGIDAHLSVIRKRHVQRITQQPRRQGAIAPRRSRSCELRPQQWFSCGKSDLQR
jgi:hypothetical protein